jgi:hypothetical protein
VSAQPARHLALVELDDGGEIVGRVTSDALKTLEADLEKAKVDLKMAQRDVKSKNRRIAELERQKSRERLEHPRYSDAVRVAKYWWLKCRAGDKRVNYKTPDRLDAVLALMEIEEIVVDADTKKKRREPHYSMEAFKAAVDGAHFDHFVKARKNGSEQHYDDLELICRSAAKFDEFVARSPFGQPPLAQARVEAHNPLRVPSAEASLASGRSSEVNWPYEPIRRSGSHRCSDRAEARGMPRLRPRVFGGAQEVSAWVDGPARPSAV